MYITIKIQFLLATHFKGGNIRRKKKWNVFKIKYMYSHDHSHLKLRRSNENVTLLSHVKGDVKRNFAVTRWFAN